MFLGFITIHYVRPSILKSSQKRFLNVRTDDKIKYHSIFDGTDIDVSSFYLISVSCSSLIVGMQLKTLTELLLEFLPSYNDKTLRCI